MARRRRRRVKPARKATAASKALLAARSTARLRLDHTAQALGVHPRTVTRWELGETRPSPTGWARLAAFFVRYVPDAAVALAAAAGVPSPIPPAVLVDERTLVDAILRAADHLDVAPRRVRATLRDIVAAVEAAHGSLRDLARAAEEPAPPDDARGTG